MTTIGLAPAHPTTRLRLTVRGRRVLAALIAAPAVVAIGIGAIGGGAALAARDAAGGPSPYHTVTVMPGDSLWSIAQRVDPRDDPRDVVDTIVRVNTLDNVSVVPGQRLSVPEPGHADR